MTLTEAAEKLQGILEKNHGLGVFSVGNDQVDTIYVYELKRGFAKQRIRPDWLPSEFKYIQKYMGKIKPAFDE